jgi:hypothetical protein
MFSVRSISFNSDAFTEEDCTALRELQEVRKLYFDRTEFDGEDLRSLPVLPSMQLLNLQGARLTDDDLAAVTRYQGQPCERDIWSRFSAQQSCCRNVLTVS